jgi:flagellar basal body-associated protein FliL
MVAYEFYSPGETGKEHLVAILPERRKNLRRISNKSILNWVKKILGNGGDIKNIYFTKVDV